MSDAGGPAAAPDDASPTIAALAAALAAAQGEFRAPVRDRENGHLRSRYTTLDGYLQATRPALAAHGLAVVQREEVLGGRLCVRSLLIHSSGEWIGSWQTVDIADAKGLSAAQTHGSAATYARRYAYAALLCLAPSDREDDDGESAPAPAAPAPAAPAPAAPAPAAPAASRALASRALGSAAEQLVAQLDAARTPADLDAARVAFRAITLSLAERETVHTAGFRARDRIARAAAIDGAIAAPGELDDAPGELDRDDDADSY